MGTTSDNNQQKTKRSGFSNACLVFLGILVGAAGCYFALTFIPEIKETLSAAINPNSIVGSDENDDVSTGASDINNTRHSESLGNEVTSEVVEEIIAEDLVGGDLSETIMDEKKKETKSLTSTKKDDTKKEKDDDYKVSDTTHKTTVVSKPCILKTGPSVDYKPIKVDDTQNEDGTKEYISSICLEDASVDNKTVTASLTVNSCPSDNNTTQDSIPLTDEQVASTEKTDVCNPVVVENPTTKYDYRPGDYVGEIIGFLGKPVSEAQAAMPSFTNKWYGSTGRLHDNHWCTVEFLYKDVVYQIDINQSDPGYSLMGVSCGMPGETARLLLAGQGYPFDPFQPGMTHWMRSEDGHFEVEVMTDLDNTVLSVAVRLL